MENRPALIVDDEDIDRDARPGQERQCIQVMEQRLIPNEHRAGLMEPLAEANSRR